MAMQGRLEREGIGMTIGGREAILTSDVVRRCRIDGPDPSGVVGGAGCEVADVGGKQDAVDVLVVGQKASNRDEGGDVAVLDHAPDVDVALVRGSAWNLEINETCRRGAYRVVPSAEKRTIARHGHTSHRDIILRNELVSALVFAQVPDPDISSTVTANEFALIRMNDNIVDRNSMAVVTLISASAGIPDLDIAIFGASDHPFSLTVESYSSDVAGVTFES